MIVIVAEKPDVGSKIAAALDKITLAGGKTISFASLKSNEKKVKEQQAKDGYLRIVFGGADCYVTWGFGHLCELKQAKDYNPAYRNWYNIPLPYIPNEYEIQIRSSNDEKWADRVARQFSVVKDLMNKADLVINATDYDREGEVIFSYIYQLAQCKKPVKRACFTSQTEKGIRDSFTRLRDGKDFANIDAAGRMRGIADWLVGSNLTVAMSIKNPGREIFSVGRVQTATLNMVVKKELDIRNFKPTPYWAIEAQFTTTSGETYKAKHQIEKIETKAEADALLLKINSHKGTVTDIRKKRIIKDPPRLYSLSSLQMDANSKYGLTLSQTLEIVQKLYDDGYTTYPRTNSQYLTEDMEPVVNGILNALEHVSAYTPLIKGKVRCYNRPYYFDDSKVESHFAIIPTENIPTSLTGYDAKVYDLICRSVIRMLYDKAITEQTKVTTAVNGEEFTSSGTTIIEPGWMTVGGGTKDDLHPLVLIGDIVDGAYSTAAKKTECPKRYNDKTLLAAMLTAGKTIDDAALRKILSDPKTGGIGTEATRASIVERLIERKYIERDGKSISATEKGIALIERLPLEQLKSAEMTARWEQRLNDIANGAEMPSAFLNDIEDAVRAWINEIEIKVTPSPSASVGGASSLGVNCPVCKKPIIKTKWGYGCSAWRDGCKFKIGTICGKTLTENQVKMLILHGKSPLIKGFTSKTGKKFDAFLKIDSNTIKFEFT